MIQLKEREWKKYAVRLEKLLIFQNNSLEHYKHKLEVMKRQKSLVKMKYFSNEHEHIHENTIQIKSINSIMKKEDKWIEKKPLSPRDSKCSESTQNRTRIKKSNQDEFQVTLVPNNGIDPDSINNSIETKQAKIEIVHSKSAAKSKKSDTSPTRLPEIGIKSRNTDSIRQIDHKNLNKDLTANKTHESKTHRSKGKDQFIKKIIIFESKEKSSSNPNNILNSIENNKLANMKKILLPPKIQKLFEKKVPTADKVIKKPTLNTQCEKEQSFKRIKSLDRINNSSILNIDSQVNNKVWYEKSTSKNATSGEKEEEQSYSDLLNSLFYSLNYTIMHEQNKVKVKDKSLCLLPMIHNADESDISSQFQNIEDSQKNISIFDDRGSINDQIGMPVQKYTHNETLKELGLDLPTLKEIIEKLKLQTEEPTKKITYENINEDAINNAFNESCKESGTVYWDETFNNKRFKGIPFSTTPVLEQPKPQNQGEIFARLELNQKMRILSDMIYKLDNHLL